MIVGWLLVLRGPGQGRDFRLRRSSTTVGRDPTCEVQLADETASREHARLRVTADSARLLDLGSSNGTYVNGERVTDTPLVDGDIIVVGTTFLLFRTATPRVDLDDVVTALPEGVPL